MPSDDIRAMPGQADLYLVSQQTEPPPAQPKRRSHGCLWAALATVAFVLLGLVGCGVFLTYQVGGGSFRDFGELTSPTGNNRVIIAARSPRFAFGPQDFRIIATSPGYANNVFETMLSNDGKNSFFGEEVQGMFVTDNQAMLKFDGEEQYAEVIVIDFPPAVSVITITPNAGHFGPQPWQLRADLGGLTLDQAAEQANELVELAWETQQNQMSPYRFQKTRSANREGPCSVHTVHGTYVTAQASFAAGNAPNTHALLAAAIAEAWTGITPEPADLFRNEYHLIPVDKPGIAEARIIANDYGVKTSVETLCKPDPEVSNNSDNSNGADVGAGGGDVGDEGGVGGAGGAGSSSEPDN